MIEKAIIPAAGYGLRLKPLSHSIPKEMFPFGKMPIIEFVLQEIILAGIKKVCVVIRKGKEIIKDYLLWRKKFYPNFELNFVYQKSPLGLGNALICAKDFIANSPFLLAIPDQVVFSRNSATKQLISIYEKLKEPCILNSMVKVPYSELVFFKGSRIFKLKKIFSNLYLVEDVCESRYKTLRGFGRTIFLAEVLKYMTNKYKNPKTGEVDFLKTFKELKKKFILYATILKGKAYDLGSWDGYYYYISKTQLLKWRI